jgi:UDP-glucose 4-epimerase
VTILLTGASGFLGRYVSSELAGQPLRLLVLPDDPALPGLRERASDVLPSAVVAGDVTRPESLPGALRGVTQVIHLAGLVNGGRGPAETFMAINARGTANLARAAREAGVAQFIYASSITVYGHVREANEAAPLVPTPGYPASKIQAERSLRALLPAQATILRLPLVLGAGDSGFMCPAVQGFRRVGRTVLVGSGRAPWSVLAASDAARAIHLCLARPDTRGDTYNVLGETVTNGELLRSIGAALDCRQEIRLPYVLAWILAVLTELSGRDGLTRVQVRALSRPMAIDGGRFARLGFVARASWREALVRGVAWCAERDSSVRSPSLSER